MSRPLRVTAVNGSYSSPSRTAGLIDLVLAELADRFPVETTRVDVAALGPGFTGALGREDLDDTAEEAVAAVERSDLLIAASPVFRGSYPGLFKHFFDQVDQYALAGRPVLLLATGGSDRHAMMIDHVMRPLLAFFQAAIAPVGIYASAGDFGGTTVLNPEVHARVGTALEDLTPLLEGVLAREPRDARPARVARG